MQGVAQPFDRVGRGDLGGQGLNTFVAQRGRQNLRGENQFLLRADEGGIVGSGRLRCENYIGTLTDLHKAFRLVQRRNGAPCERAAGRRQQRAKKQCQQQMVAAGEHQLAELGESSALIGACHSATPFAEFPTRPW